MQVVSAVSFKAFLSIAASEAFPSGIYLLLLFKLRAFALTLNSALLKPG